MPFLPLLTLSLCRLNETMAAPLLHPTLTTNRSSFRLLTLPNLISTNVESILYVGGASSPLFDDLEK